MTGRMCVAAALAIWFSGTAEAQALRSLSIRTSLGRPTLPTASTRSDRSDDGSTLRPARSFEELQARVKTGDLVYVIDASGVSTRGEIAALSDVSLTLTLDGTRRDFAVSAVRRIERRRRDSVRNGVLIGLGSGALVGLLAGRSADSPSCPASGIECGQGALIGAIGGAVWGAVGGWISDALIHKRDVIYLAQGQPG